MTGHVSEIAKRILDTLPPCMHKIRAEVRSSRDSELTFPQFRILANIGRGLRHVMEIAETHGVSQPAMSKMVEGLARRGLVERLPDSNDRRKVELALTAKGKDVFNGIRRDVELKLSCQISELSPDERRDLSRGLFLLRKLLLHEVAK